MPTAIDHNFNDIDAAGRGDFLDEFSTTNSTDVSERKGTAGAITLIKPHNPTSTFSLKGGGNLALTVGVVTLAVTSLSGGVKVLNSFGHTEKVSDFDECTAEGKHYPSGAVWTA